jgi:hypothetical protein
VQQYRGRLVEAYLALVQLVKSRVITQPTKLTAETLKTKLEEELAQEEKTQTKTLEKKAAS